MPSRDQAEPPAKGTILGFRSTTLNTERLGTDGPNIAENPMGEVELTSKVTRPFWLLFLSGNASHLNAEDPCSADDNTRPESQEPGNLDPRASSFTRSFSCQKDAADDAEAMREDLPLAVATVLLRLNDDQENRVRSLTNALSVGHHPASFKWPGDVVFEKATEEKKRMSELHTLYPSMIDIGDPDTRRRLQRQTTKTNNISTELHSLLGMDERTFVLTARETVQSVVQAGTVSRAEFWTTDKEAVPDRRKFSWEKRANKSDARETTNNATKTREEA